MQTVETDEVVATASQSRLRTVQLTFEKQGTARWLGHLDVMRTFERAFRRCGAPVALSQGHNPRPKLRFVFPASVGLTATADVLFADLVERSPEQASEPLDVSVLNDALPLGLRVVSVTPVPSEARRSALASYTAAQYVARCECSPATDTVLLSSVAQSLATDGMIPARRPADGTGHIRELRAADHVVSVRVSRPSATEVELHMVVRFGRNGTLRPADFAAAMAEHVKGLRLLSVERTALLAEMAAGDATK